jgi:hypothetical protein
MWDEVIAMDDIAAQVAALIAEAPTDAETQIGVRAIAPLLGELAEQFGSPQFYILQNFNQQWQITTLQNRHQPDLEKRVVYCYRQLSDATRAGQTDSLIAVPLPTVQLLFHFLTISQIDSLLFVQNAFGEEQPIELSQTAIQSVVQEYLQQLSSQNSMDSIA